MTKSAELLEEVIGPYRLVLIESREINPNVSPYFVGWHHKPSNKYDGKGSASFEVAVDLYKTKRAYFQDREEAKAERRAKRKAERDELVERLGNPYKVGDILYDSWGYEQTNIDWYEIVEVKARSVVLRKIAGKLTVGTGFMSGETVPEPGKFIGEPETMPIQYRAWSGGTVYISSKHGWISKWNGEPKYCSWYA